LSTSQASSALSHHQARPLMRQQSSRCVDFPKVCATNWKRREVASTFRWHIREAWPPTLPVTLAWEQELPTLRVVLRRWSDLITRLGRPLQPPRDTSSMASSITRRASDRLGCEIRRYFTAVSAWSILESIGKHLQQAHPAGSEARLGTGAIMRATSQATDLTAPKGPSNGVAPKSHSDSIFLKFFDGR